MEAYHFKYKKLKFCRNVQISIFLLEVIQVNIDVIGCCSALARSIENSDYRTSFARAIYQEDTVIIDHVIPLIQLQAAYRARLLCSVATLSC